MVLQWITQSYCKTSFFLILQIRASVLHMVTWSTVPLSSRWSKRHSERESTHLILNIGQVEQFMSNITVLKQLCTLFLLKTLSMAAALIHLFSILFFSSVCLTEAHLADMVTNTHTQICYSSGISREIQTTKRHTANWFHTPGFQEPICEIQPILQIKILKKWINYKTSSLGTRMSSDRRRLLTQHLRGTIQAWELFISHKTKTKTKELLAHHNEKN